MLHPSLNLHRKHGSLPVRMPGSVKAIAAPDRDSNRDFAARNATGNHANRVGLRAVLR